MNNRPQPPRRPQAGNQRPAAQQQPTAAPRRVQRDATQDYARRKAAYERQLAEKRRREAQRKRKVRVFWGRLLVFFVILIILAAVACAGFALYFNHSDPPPEPTTVRYTYNGADSVTLEEDKAYLNGILYVDFSDLAARFGLVAVGGAEEMRFVIPTASASDTTDSDGTGLEEDVIFRENSDLATVNGQDVRLDGPAVLDGEHYLIPAGFITEYMEGIALTRIDNEVAIARTYTEDEANEIAFTLKRPAAVEPLPEDTEVGEIDPNHVVTSGIFVDAIVGGGYKWIGYGVLITVIPLVIVAIIARLKFKINYYTMMGMMSGAMTDPPALGFSSTSAGNDMPAMGYATVYPVVMFLRVLTAQLLMLMAIPAVASAATPELSAPVEEAVEVVEAPVEETAEAEAATTDQETVINYEDVVVTK